MDKIRNKIYRRNMKIKPITIIRGGAIRWFVHISRINGKRLTKKVYDVRSTKPKHNGGLGKT